MRPSMNPSCGSPAGRHPRSPLRAVAVAVALATMSAPVFALGLGAPDVTSYLGQPLQMRVPVVLDDPADGLTHCPRIVPNSGSDVPTLSLGRIDLERGVTQSFLRISTALPIDEPVLRVVVEIGCQRRVQREFVLLLDPPSGVAQRAPAPVAVAPRLDFGRPEVLGTRGQPLLMTVPITGELAPSLSNACVRAVPGETSEMPRVLTDARVTVVEAGDKRALRIQTPDPVNDARVRVLVELGCEQPLRHEFVVQLDAPRLASTPAVAEDAVKAAPRVATPVTKRPPPPRVAPQPKPALPPVATAPVPPTTLETPATPAAAAPAVEPSRAAPGAAPKSDRLVLSAPEDVVQPLAPRSDADPKVAPPASAADEREQVIKRLEQLSTEVKTLRAELDASTQRNRELSTRAQSASYAWAIAAGAALLLGVGLLLGRRGRGRNNAAADADQAGPMTRILGKHQDTQMPAARAAAPVAAAQPAAPSMTEAGSHNTVAAIIAAHRAAHGHGMGHDDTGPSTDIVVTEFGDSSQAINELYLPYVGKSGKQGAAGRALPLGRALPDDARTTVLAPPTKTEIAVDIDLGSNTEIARDLQREYERLGEKAPDGGVKGAQDAELPTRLATDGDVTIPATPSKLSLDLDLDLDLPTVVGKPKKNG